MLWIDGRTFGKDSVAIRVCIFPYRACAKRNLPLKEPRVYDLQRTIHCSRRIAPVHNRHTMVSNYLIRVQSLWLTVIKMTAFMICATLSSPPFWKTNVNGDTVVTSDTSALEVSVCSKCTVHSKILGLETATASMDEKKSPYSHRKKLPYPLQKLCKRIGNLSYLSMAG